MPQSRAQRQSRATPREQGMGSPTERQPPDPLPVPGPHYWNGHTHQDGNQPSLKRQIRPAWKPRLSCGRRLRTARAFFSQNLAASLGVLKLRLVEVGLPEDADRVEAELNGIRTEMIGL